MGWNEKELRKIGEADDLHISPFRDDGVTYGTPTWIWSVVVDNNLYVRGYKGLARAGACPSVYSVFLNVSGTQVTRGIVIGL